jgi:ssDNA-binding replication factor A large subunit
MMRFIGENTARQLLADVGLKAENVLRPESFTDIKDGMRAVTATGKVVQIGPTQFRRQRSGPTYRFAQAVLEADGRQCKLTLWGAETDLVKEGDRIRIINGYTREYNGVTTLQSGKYGKIEVLESRGIDRSSAPSAEDTVRSSEENATGAPTPIADLRDGMTDVTVEGIVVKVEPPRSQ